ncbi:UDP-glucose 4-epimerase [compost metagenome]
MKVACEAALGKRSGVDVFGTDYATVDGTCVRDYIHVSDLVAAHLNALERMAAGVQSITANCGYGHGYSVLQVLDRLRTLVTSDFAVRYGPRRSGDAVEVVADATIARRELQWKPQYDDLSVILRSALDWEARLDKHLANVASA